MLVKLIHLAQIVLAAYGAIQSQAAITNLLAYEDATKKLAKISGEVERQLHKTRTTQAAGAINILVSFIVSVLLLARGAAYGPFLRYLSSPVMALALLGSKMYIQDFWAGKNASLSQPTECRSPKWTAITRHWKGHRDLFKSWSGWS